MGCASVFHRLLLIFHSVFVKYITTCTVSCLLFISGCVDLILIPGNDQIIFYVLICKTLPLKEVVLHVYIYCICRISLFPFLLLVS